MTDRWESISAGREGNRNQWKQAEEERRGVGRGGGEPPRGLTQSDKLAGTNTHTCSFESGLLC